MITQKDNWVRMATYIAMGLLTYAMGDLDKMREADAIDWARFVIGCIIAGLVPFRAYIDQTPAQLGQAVASATGATAKGPGSSLMLPAVALGTFITLGLLPKGSSELRVPSAGLNPKSPIELRSNAELRTLNPELTSYDR